MRVLYVVLTLCTASVFRSDSKDFNREERDLIVKAGLVGVNSLEDAHDLGLFIKANGIPSLKHPIVSDFLQNLILDDPSLIFSGKGSVSLLLVYAAARKISNEFKRPDGAVERWSEDFIKELVPFLVDPTFAEVRRYVRNPKDQIIPRLLFNDMKVEEDEFTSQIVMPYMESLARFGNAPFMAVPVIHVMVNGKRLSRPIPAQGIWQVLEICKFPMQRMIDHSKHFEQLAEFFEGKLWNLNLIGYAWSNAFDFEHWIRLIPILSLHLPRHIPGDPIFAIRNLLRHGLDPITCNVVGLGYSPRYPSLQVNVLINLLKRHPVHCTSLSEDLLNSMISLWSHPPHERNISLILMNQLMIQLKRVLEPSLMRALYLSIISSCLSIEQMKVTLVEAMKGIPLNSTEASATRKSFLSLFFILPLSVLLDDVVGLERLFMVWAFHSKFKNLLITLDDRFYMAPIRRMFSNLCAQPESLLSMVRSEQLSLEFVALLEVKFVVDVLEGVEVIKRNEIVGLLPEEMQSAIIEVLIVRDLRSLNI